MWALLTKELNSYFNSLVAYIVIGIFLIFSGLVTWFFPDTNVLDYGYADLGSFFQFSPYLFFFLIPALTMRQFADEFKSGTFELLMTKPLTLKSIISGKFFAVWLTIFVALVPTIVYYFSVYELGNPPGNVDTASVIGAYAGLLLLAGVMVSIGLFTSSLTDNLIVAFVLGAALCAFFYLGIHLFSQLFSGKTQYFIDYLSLSFQYDALGRGVIDSRNIIYFASLMLLFLYLTFLKTSNR